MKGSSAGIAARVSRMAIEIALGRAGLAAGIAAAGLASPPALAQDGGAQNTAEQAGEQYADTIIVTATKREQTLQDVPVAVTVTTGATLERAQIRDLKDLQSVVPSLRVNQLQSSANTNFYIRGFGNGANNAGIEPSVGLFVDGVYRSRSASMIADFPDVERIEVLRGPQSTLFGKNASAGVISIVTRKPQFEFGGNVEASYGNYDAVVVKGVVTGPITENIAFSLAGGINRRDGIVKDLADTGARTNERDRWFTRGQLLFDNHDGFEVRLIGDYSKIDENCCAVVNLRQAAPTAAIFALGGAVNQPGEKYDNIGYNNFQSSNNIKNWGVSGELSYDLGDVKLTSITSYRRTDAVTNQDSDFSSADLLGRNWQDLQIKTFTQELRASFEVGDQISGLIGGYYFNEKIDQNNQVLWGDDARTYADLLVRSLSGGALNVPTLETVFGASEGNPAKYTNHFFASGTGLTEAYKLKNESYSGFGQLDFEVAPGLIVTGGINYTHDTKRFATGTTSNDVFAGIDFNDRRYAGFRQTLLYQGALSQTVGNLLGLGRSATAAEIGAFAGANGAAFAQVNAGATAFAAGNANNPSANPLNGLRALQYFPPFMNLPNAVEPGRVSDGDFSYTARVAWDVNPAINLYAAWATGYKAASINLSRDSRPTPADLVALRAQGLAVTNLTSGSRFANAENATVYELGFKGNWGIVSANVAVFKQIIKNFQSNIFTGSGFFLANAGKQSAFGIEFEGSAKPIDPLTLTLSWTYLDPKYDTFQLSAFGDLSGTTPAGVSPLSVTFGAEFVQPVGSGGDRVILRGDYHYEAQFRLVEGLPGLVTRDAVGNVTSVAAALAAAREFKQDINDVNASLTYAMASGIEVSVWGRNLLNDRTILQIFDSPAQPGSISGYPNQPRTYGVAARYRF
ncbi:TonB-dependent receptor [Novosphingobium sp. P6W]|uniref:TonB-dependent receptor n=1 Tax=Novosphingobium sp. P6W TaxID=1609758 RepID=UPI0005C31C7B|nr:TonB-dependent receptor [Novosphingobium sp. P6W]AXB75810.1 TonB-dependent receptor [Novosphingobium sp. P6W]KIS32983.1 TonB-dependent receptor [Novosphingobium sp. P6W]